ncbi:MAG: hypothetical protein J2P24_13550, partial [Streptosporangiales bacterium]|nr:hypothetical protein [Streptosporangiales bacterium]
MADVADVATACRRVGDGWVGRADGARVGAPVGDGEVGRADGVAPPEGRMRSAGGRPSPSVTGSAPAAAT